MNKMFSKMLDHMKVTMIPQVDNTIRMTFDGKLVVETNTPDGKAWVTADGVIIPEDLICDEFPVLTVAKAAKDVKVGDVVKLTKSTYGVVTCIKDGKIKITTFGGDNREAKAFKDLLFGEGTVRVVVNMFTSAGTDNQVNPLALMALCDNDEDDEKSSLKDILLMSAFTGSNGSNPFGNITTNPMMLWMLMGKEGKSSNLLPLLLMQNGGLNLFNTSTTPEA